jgi:hypothetical protein
MAFQFYNTAGGLVDETCWGDNTGATYTMGAFVYNLGNAPYPNNYSFLASLNNPSGSNGSNEGFMLVANGDGPIIRMMSRDTTGTIELDSDIHTYNLTTAQLQRVHLGVTCSKNERKLYIDGILTLTDTRTQTGPQYFTSLIIGYGGKSPVSMALVQLLSGYGSQADMTMMASCVDIRDLALASNFRLSPVRQFLRQNNLLEDTTLYNGFLLNNGGVYQKKLELDIPPDSSGNVTFDNNLPAMTPWSGKGGVSQTQNYFED